MDRKLAEELRQRYPIPVPLAVAGKLLGVSPRQLSRLVADGREPFASIGANIGIKQRYIRIYTERLIAYLDAALEVE